MPQLESNVGI